MRTRFILVFFRAHRAFAPMFSREYQYTPMFSKYGRIKLTIDPEIYFSTKIQNDGIT